MRLNGVKPRPESHAACRVQVASPATGGSSRRAVALCALLAMLHSGSSLAQTSNTRGLSNDQIKRRGIAQVVVHDVAIPVGLLPFPSVQYAAEAVEMGTNLSLKALPPRLFPPAAVSVQPAAGECTYGFDLPSPNGGYENMFGFWHSYEYEDPNWGVLGPPTLRHWNTRVDIAVDTPYTVEFPDGSSEPRAPMGPDGDFLFPIGEHVVRWTADTKLNIFSDIAAPGIMLAFGVLTEFKSVKAAKPAAELAAESKEARKAAMETASQAPAGVKRQADFVERKWRQTWRGDKDKVRKILNGEAGTVLDRKFAKKVMCRAVPLMLGVIDDLVAQNYEFYDGSIPASLLPDVSSRTLADMTLKEWGIVAGETHLETIRPQLAAAICTDPDDMGEKQFEIVLGSILKFVGKLPLSKLFEKTTASSYASQPFTVLDTVPPTIHIDPATVYLEASTPDGIPGRRAEAHLLELAPPVTADNCGRTPLLLTDLPVVLELQQRGDTPHTVTWTALDRGPNPPDSPHDFSPTAAQYVQVLDTQPPLLLAPPPIVYIADAGAAQVSRELLEEEKPIGNALATDLVDVTPTIAEDIPGSFPVNKRTTVTWTATDDSGNTAGASQLITVKDSNTAPVATRGIRGETLTTESIAIRLTGSDPDILDGKADPLWFSIERYPTQGEFVAPLHPFFIDDLRRDSSDAFPDKLDTYLDENDCGEKRAACVRDFVSQEYCSTEGDYAGTAPPRDFVHQPLSLQVGNQGSQFFIDSYLQCGVSDGEVEEHKRISKWNEAHEYLGQLNFGPTPDDWPVNGSIRLDQDDSIQFFTRVSHGSSSVLRIHRCSSEFSGEADATSDCDNVGSVEQNELLPERVCSNLDLQNIVYARWNSSRQLVYMATNDSVYVFANNDGSLELLGDIGPAGTDCRVEEKWLGTVSGLEVATDGSVYVADNFYSRIHKLEATTVTSDLSPFAYSYTGWAGRCSGSDNKACNEDEGRTRGYSCTDATCLADVFEGDGPGQFNDISYIELDSRDILYVADYGNSRVQRLSPDGQFSGEAASTGTGVGDGDKPSFVLGNFGNPEIVAVSSGQLFIIGNTDDFVHLFETLPFTDITDTGVTVQYKSDEDMPFPANDGQDSFVFSVTDGDLSDQATVLVDVSRHYRAPIAFAGAAEVEEDSSVSILLMADDPDGIQGKDYYGRDVLTYQISQPPQHGSISGEGAARRYTPDPDYFGPDSFRFRVNDGNEDSNEAEVSVVVIPVNDPPELTLDLPQKAGVGFPLVLTASFTDDDVYPGSTMDPAGTPVASDEDDSRYRASIRWAKTELSLTGRFNDDDVDNPYIDGVAIADPPAFGLEGRLFAEHTYSSTGPKTIQGCVLDGFAETHCDSIVVEVEELARIQLSVEVEEVLAPGETAAEEHISEIEDGKLFHYSFSVLNRKPQYPDRPLPGPGIPRPGGPLFAGLTAGAVTLSAHLPKGLNYLDLSYPAGVSCRRAGLQLTCEFGDLPPADPEQMLTVRVLARSSGRLLRGEEVEVNANLTTTSPALDAEIGQSFNLYVAARDSDDDGMSDVYEHEYGLNPLVDDAAEDADKDGLTNLEEFELGTSPLATDTDMDGLSDAEEARTLGTDPLNPDSDGDRMYDGWEYRHGLDPLNGMDADLDSDGDGVSNLDEFLADTDPTRDDIAPVVTAPADLQVPSTGELTAVSLGRATAFDGADGGLPTSASETGPFRSGHHDIIWSAIDTAGNLGTDVQVVKVIPQANFPPAQAAPEGVTVTVPVELNGPAADYPVVIPYEISGSATAGEDHDAVGGEILIERGLIGSVEFNILADLTEDPNEDILISMGEPENAIAGEFREHRIRISEDNLPPLVAINIEQDGRAGSIVVASGGAISIAAVISDHPDDEHTLYWGNSDAGMFDPQVASAPSYTLDPAALQPGFYFLRAEVTDNTPGAPTTVVIVPVQVLAEAPLLHPQADSDGDGLADAVEGFGDRDGDRIPDYLDAEDSTALLPLDMSGASLQSTTGNLLRLGHSSFRNAATAASLLEELLGSDVDYGYPNALVDAELVLDKVGGVAKLVIPLPVALPEDAVFRLFSNATWRDLAEGEFEGVASAPGVGGGCPGPGSKLYKDGLTAGSHCVQLTVQDGGPNDADEMPNGVISLLGGLAVPVNITYATVDTPRLQARNADERVLGEILLESTSGDVQLHSLVIRIAASSPVNDRYGVSLVMVLDDAGGKSRIGSVLGETEIGSGSDNISFTLVSPHSVPAGSTRLAVLLHRLTAR